MMQTVFEFFNSQNFMPHGHCYLWRPDILWLHVGSDALVGVAYYSIPVALLTFVRQRGDVTFKWIFVLFAVFIFSCGSTHLFSVYTTWYPSYFAEGIVKALTATVSVITAILLWPLIPRAIALPSPQQLREKNDELKNLNENLETIVARRTKDSAQLAAIVNSSADAILAKDLDGCIKDWNSGAEALYGYTRGEIVGRHISILFPAGVEEEYEEIMEKVRAGKAAANIETVRRAKDGHLIDISLTVSPIKNSENDIIGFSSISRDITFKKLAEQRIMRANEELKATNAEMEQFVYAVSHDLKSPLVTSTSFLNFLKEDLEAQNYAAVLDSARELEAAHERMKQLINDLLEVSRVGRVEKEVERVNSGEVVANVLEGHAEQIREKGIEVEVSDAMPVLNSNTSRLVQVFDNLISNAIKYGATGSEPKILIKAEEAQGEHRICIKDQGPGIEPKYHEKVFQLFQRLDIDQEGTGLGLAIVERVMRTHGGRVWVVSEPGKGAEFWLAFPHKLKEFRRVMHE